MPGTTWGTAEAISGQTGSVSGTDTNSNYWWWVFTGEEGLAYDFAISGDASGNCWVGGTGENNYDAISSFQIPDYYGRPTVRLTGAGTTPVHIRVSYSSGPFTITWSVAAHATPETAQPFSGESGSLDYGSDQWCVFTPEPGMLYTFTAPTRMSLYTSGTPTGDYKVLGYGAVMVPGGDQPLYVHSDAGSTGTLTWTSMPDTDTNPNDTWQTATPIDGSTAGSIAYEDAHQDRQEWFLLNAQVGSFYLFSCDEPNGYYELYSAPTGDETAPSYTSYGFEPDAHLGFTAEVEQYYVVVYPSYAGATGTLSWTLEAPPDPPPYVVANDLQENAVVIDVTANGSIAYDNTGATGTEGTQDLRTIWFKLTPAALMRFAVTATPPVPDSYAEPIVSLIGTDLYSTSESNTASATLPAHVDTYVQIAFPWGNQGLWSQGTLSWTVTPVPDNALPTGALDISTAPRQPIDFAEGADPATPSTRYFTYTATSTGPFIAVLGDATLNPVGTTDSYGTTDTTMRVFSADGSAYYGSTNYRSTSNPTARFARNVKEGEQLQISVISKAGTPVLLRWGMASEPELSTLGEWQDSKVGTYGESGWYSYGGSALEGGAVWPGETGRSYYCDSQGSDYQGDPPLGNAPYQGPPDPSTVPILTAEVQAGHGGVQCGEAITRTKDRDAGAAGSPERQPYPGRVNDGGPTDVGYWVAVQQGPFYWVAIDNPDNQPDVIDGGTYAQNEVDVSFGYFANGFSEVDEKDIFFAYAPIIQSRYYEQFSYDFASWIAGRAVQWSDGTVGPPSTQKSMISVNKVASVGNVDTSVGFYLDTSSGTPGTGWRAPDSFRSGQLLKSVSVGPGETIEVSPDAPEVLDVPFVPGQTYRVAAVPGGPVIPAITGPVGNFATAKAVVGYAIEPGVRYPDQYRVGDWSEKDVLPPLDGGSVVPIDQGLSTSNLTATPSGPTVYFTGS